MPAYSLIPLFFFCTFLLSICGINTLRDGTMLDTNKFIGLLGDLFLLELLDSIGFRTHPSKGTSICQFNFPKKRIK